MCGLFGFSIYGDYKFKDLKDITNSLAEQSAIRGTDATGIAYNEHGKLNIVKDGKSAYVLDFKHSDDIKVLIGHTRHSTHGSEMKNCNNHPFYGKCKNGVFALAHNGVLANDIQLREDYKLPKTKVETDSYIAVQLLEHKKKLNENSIKFMAEALVGSFSFSILDSHNLWLVKGDSPLHILHFVDKGIYVYASTEEILWKALIETDLFEDLKEKRYEVIPIARGTILKISPSGKLEYSTFEFQEYKGFVPCRWWQYGVPSCYGIRHISEDETEYIKELKSVAQYQGYSAETVDDLIAAGFALEEIEEYIYEV